VRDTQGCSQNGSLVKVRSGSLGEPIDRVAKPIRSFEPVAGTHTHGLVDTWYSAKCIWQAGRERGFDITTGLKSNRALRVPDPTQPQGWRWQRLAEYVAHGRVIRAGRSLTVCAGDVVAINDEKETVVATMLATMMAVTAPA